MKRLITILAFIMVLPSLSVAQSWPEHDNIFVNDLAGVLADDAEARLRSELELLRDETGVELTVLTISTRKEYQLSGGTLTEFATGLFNHWGIGDATKNDGILVLLITDNHEMRIELGAGYSDGYDRVAGAIIDRVFLPLLKSGEMTQAIEDGTGAIIDGLARANAAGQPAPEPEASTGGNAGMIFGGGFLVLILALIFGKRIKNRMASCPTCGKRGMQTAHTKLEAATKTTKGQGEKTITCTHCDYSSTTQYTIPIIRKRSSSSSSSGGSFGGGSSSGGGASGKW